MKKNLLAVAALTVMASTAAHAEITLIADGTISGSYEDPRTETAAALENGSAGNMLGGMGSGFAYGGGDTFYALPDRGPNAVSYNDAIDDTASYIPRFHKMTITLAPATDGSALPYVATPFVTRTELMWSAQPLFYGDGGAYNVPDGTPALNAVDGRYYFSGRSDNFDASKNSLNDDNARLDPESIRVSPDGKFVYISDEYGPYIYQFKAGNGKRVNRFKLPKYFAVTNLSPVGSDEIDGNTKGRVANKGMEGLAISPDGATLIGMMQSPLLQDGGTSGGYTRIVTIDIATGTTHEYAYPLTNIGTESKVKYPTISDIVAVNSHQFLVDERDGKGLGDDSEAVSKKVYLIDLDGADDVSGISGESKLATHAISKTLFLDLISTLEDNGYAAADIPSKMEGLAFGKDITIDGVTRHTLYVTTDNDFIPTVTDTYHPNGVANPNHFFVFSVDASDLPDYQAQTLPED